MTRLWPEGEPIEMRVDGQGRPLRFIWQGRAHQVEQLQQRWQVDSDWWSEEGRVRRDYLTVTTANGLLCVLYFDMLDQSWYLAKLYD